MAVYKIATYSTKVTEQLDSVADACDFYPGSVLLDSQSDHWLYWLIFPLLLDCSGGTRWSSWLRHCATSRKVAGSFPDGARPHYGPWIDPASNGNGYQEYFLEGKGGRCVGLTTLPLSRANCLEIWKPQPLGTLKAYAGITVILLGSSRQLPIYYFITDHGRRSQSPCILRHGSSAARLLGLEFVSHWG
jgi:hypothetical protein